VLLLQATFRLCQTTLLSQHRIDPHYADEVDWINERTPQSASKPFFILAFRTKGSTRLEESFYWIGCQDVLLRRRFGRVKLDPIKHNDLLSKDLSGLALFWICSNRQTGVIGDSDIILHRSLGNKGKSFGGSCVVAKLALYVFLFLVEIHKNCFTDWNIRACITVEET
jgi:hypothetical protein